MKKHNRYTIGLFGAELFNSNMGCLALTYSLVSLLKKNKYSNFFQYIFFVRNRHGDISEFCRTLNVSKEQIAVVSCMNLKKTDLFLRDKLFKKSIKKCDVVIDITQGDSFTDIYGNERFNVWTSEKEWIIENNIPLILAPQTIGPFVSTTNYDRAKAVLQKCELVSARDDISYELAYKMKARTLLHTSDLAFALPFNKSNLLDQKKLIGLNVSGLLWSDSVEKTKKSFSLTTNYQDYIKRIIEYFKEKTECKLVLISHVAADFEIAKILSQENGISYTPLFKTPVEAKSYISGLDVFIGARMHATIAAISSGVPTMPVAYSRKFTGLFGTIEYPYVVDLTELDTEEAYKLTVNMFDETDLMKKKIPSSIEKANLLLGNFIDVLNQYIECQF